MFRFWNTSFPLGRFAAVAIAALLFANLVTQLRSADFDPEADLKHEGPNNADELQHNGDGSGHGAAHGSDKEAEEKPDYSKMPLGPELEGFDLSVLRAAKRVEDFRYELKDMRGVTLPPSRPLHLSVVVEFGAKTGLAELARKEDLIKVLLGEEIGAFSPQELLTPAGKLRLKEAIVDELNGRLTTARVRQVYFTDFRLLPAR